MKPSLILAQEVLAAQPFSAMLRTQIVTFDDEQAVLKIDITGSLLQQHGLVHGGVISYLIDNAVTFAAGTALGSELVTAAITVDYLRPATGAALVARAWVVSHTAAHAVMRCDVTAEGNGKSTLCAVGTGRANLRTSRS